MKLVKNNFHLNKASALRITTFIVILTIFLSSSFFTTNSNNKAEDLDRNFNDISQIPVSADIDSVLFEGIELPLNITDYGNLYDSNQDVSLSNQEGLNLTYYLDEIHDWKASQINISVNDIYDTRNWVNNSGFNSPTIFRVYQEFETSHPYNQPHNPSSVIHTIV
ncbi:MAG: hypothetical protein ACFFCG_03575 [Promethearchaeota archaeon]